MSLGKLQNCPTRGRTLLVKHQETLEGTPAFVFTPLCWRWGLVLRSFDELGGKLSGPF